MDNYAEFLQRLNAAETNLKKRQDALGHVLSVVSAAFEDNNYGNRQWAERVACLEKLISNPDIAARPSIKELHAVALNMESVFRTRRDRVGARLTAVQKRINEMNRPLKALNLSKQRLTASRRLAEEREKLSKAVQGVAGTADGSATATPDSGLRDDLKTAREAVVLAEALLELKGT